MSPAPSIGVALANSLIARLNGDYAPAATLARLVAARPNAVIDAHSAAIEPRTRFERIAQDFVERRWLMPAGRMWATGPLDIPPGVPSFLEGAAFMHVEVLSPAQDVDSQIRMLVVRCRAFQSRIKLLYK